MAIRKSIGAKVDQDVFDQITQFCDKNRISKVELVLDGIAVMMGRDARVYERINELEEHLECANDEIMLLEGRGLWARIRNKGVKKYV